MLDLKYHILSLYTDACKFFGVRSCTHNITIQTEKLKYIRGSQLCVVS